MTITKRKTIIIRPLNECDIEDVARIHLEQLPDSRSSSLGFLFVCKMYRWFIETQPELAHVALFSDQTDRVAGFVTGAIGGYGRKIFRFALTEVIIGLITHPANLFRRDTYTLWYSYILGIIPRRSSSDKHENPSNNLPNKRASLSSIAVKKSAQGQGVGKALVTALEESARQQGALRLTLSTDKDYIPARHLYESCGWHIESEPHELNSVTYVKNLD